LNNGVVTLEIHAVKGVSVVRKISIQRYFRFSWTVRTKHDFSFITNRTALRNCLPSGQNRRKQSVGVYFWQ